MVWEGELLGQFFSRTFLFCFVFRLFHEMERDVFPSLFSYSDIVSLLLPAAEIMGLIVVFKTSFPFKSVTSISSQPSHMVPYDCGLPSLVQETAKNLLLWDTPSRYTCLYPSGGTIFSRIPSWPSFSCLHGCLPSQLTASVPALGDGAVRHFRGKDANSSAAGCCFAVHEHSNYVN